MDEGEEQENLISKAFDIYEDISGYNPKESPSNGFEYLHQVMCENSKLPKTMVAAIDVDKFKTLQTFYVSDGRPYENMKIDLLPTQEWQQHQLRNFINLRDKVNHMKTLYGRNKLSLTNSLPSDIDNEQSWLEFCNQSPPLLQVLFSIQQPGIIKLLNYFCSWLTDDAISFSPNTTRWLYSIFATLEEPLWPATFADLRDVLRLARERRSSIESSEDCLLAPLNLIICVGARHFRQNDLSD